MKERVTGKGIGEEQREEHLSLPYGERDRGAEEREERREEKARLKKGRERVRM